MDFHSSPMMKASLVHRFGPPEVIVFEDIERPAPAAGEVLVRVKAAGVGPWDAWVRAGKSALPQPLPLTLGSDLSGIVEKIGGGVTGLAPGDEVFGVTNPSFTGADAEYAVASSGMVAGKPRKITHVEAASVPVVAVTAWQMLDHAGVVPGQTVLIHGAAGNVGAYAVQLASLRKVRVIATASAGDLDYVRGFGAGQVIDFRSVRFEDVSGPVDAVIDTVGGEVQSRSFQVLKAGGALVSSVSQPDPLEAERRGVRVIFFLVDVSSFYLTRIAQMIDAGELIPCVGAVVPLAEAREAHEMLQGSRPHPRGIVLKVGE